MPINNNGKIGQLYELKQDVDRYPHFKAKKGLVGRLVQYDDDEVRLHMKAALFHDPAWDEWGNCIVWDNKEEFHDDCEALAF